MNYDSAQTYFDFGTSETIFTCENFLLRLAIHCMTQITLNRRVSSNIDRTDGLKPTNFRSPPILATFLRVFTITPRNVESRNSTAVKSIITFYYNRH